MSDDKVGDAVQAEAQKLEMTQMQVNFGSSGRPMMLAVPADMTDREMFDLIAWVASDNGLRRSVNRPKSRLVLPGLS